MRISNTPLKCVQYGNRLGHNPDLDAFKYFQGDKGGFSVAVFGLFSREIKIV